MALRLLGRGNKIALPREVPWPYESLKSKGTPAEMADPQGEGSRLGVTAATTRIFVEALK